MNAIPWGLVFFALGFAGRPVQTAAASVEVRPDSIAKWEYQVLTKEQVIGLGKKDLAAGLNQLGGAGWELAGIDGAYIFKRPKDSGRQQTEQIKRAIPLIEADIVLLKDRVGWAERMLRKGYLSQRQVESERLRLKGAELALERARSQLDQLPLPTPSGPPTTH
jgi:hypothetical protein